LLVGRARGVPVGRQTNYSARGVNDEGSPRLALISEALPPKGHPGGPTATRGERVERTTGARRRRQQESNVERFLDFPVTANKRHKLSAVHNGLGVAGQSSKFPQFFWRPEARRLSCLLLSRLAEVQRGGAQFPSFQVAR